MHSLKFLGPSSLSFIIVILGPVKMRSRSRHGLNLDLLSECDSVMQESFFCFLFSWTEVLLANALTVIDAKPINAIMTRVASVFSSNIPILSAAGLLTIIPGIIFVIFLRKYLVKGFSLGRID